MRRGELVTLRRIEEWQLHRTEQHRSDVRGEHDDGEWRAGVTHAGRWCDVFEVRDYLIQRCFIYLDPDYAGKDTERYPWLAERTAEQSGTLAGA